MKNWTLILFAMMCFAELFAQITIYEEIGKDPDESMLSSRAEEAQGVASDRRNYWFFSNRYHIYKYDENFSNVSQDNVGTLSEVNDAIDSATCGHIGSS